MIIEIEDAVAFEILEVLRLTPIYALLGSEFEAEIAEDFKPWKWQGYEKEHAEKSVECHRALLNAMRRAVDLAELSPRVAPTEKRTRGTRG